MRLLSANADDSFSLTSFFGKSSPSCQVLATRPTSRPKRLRISALYHAENCLAPLQTGGDLDIISLLTRKLPSSPYKLWETLTLAMLFFRIHRRRMTRRSATFNNLTNALRSGKRGYEKIQFCKEQAHKDRVQYFWVNSSIFSLHLLQFTAAFWLGPLHLYASRIYPGSSNQTPNPGV
jgi:hypothetical protein